MHIEEWKQKLLDRKVIPRSFGKITREEYEDIILNELLAFNSGGIRGPTSAETKKMISETNKLRGIRPPPNTHTKGTFWWNDGVVNKRSKTCPEGLLKED